VVLLLEKEVYAFALKETTTICGNTAYLICKVLLTALKLIPLCTTTWGNILKEVTPLLKLILANH